MIKRQNTMRRGVVSPMAPKLIAMWMLAAMLTLVAAAPAFGEVVEGFVDGFGGDCDGPGTPCSAGTGFVGVFGWASAPSGIHRIEILLESVQFPGTVHNLGRATYGLERDGLGPVGWAYNINSPLFANGLYDVWARVVTVGGTTEELAAKQVLFTNSTSLLRPFGELERPGHNEDVFGTCERYFRGDGLCEVGLGENCLNSPGDCNGQEIGAFDDFCCGYDAGPNPISCDDPQPPATPGGGAGGLVCQQAPYACSEERQIRYAVFSGWALDLGVAGDQDTGISWVEPKINGALRGNTRAGCEFDSRLGGLTNCYGLPRLDLENEYPFAFDAPSAGYRFVLDIGALLEADLATMGSNELIVRAGDWADQVDNIDQKSVNFLCAEDFSEPAFGVIEAPRDGRLYTGALDFVGWALDGEAVETVDIYIDGLFEARLVEGAAFSDMAMTSPIPGGFAFDADDADFDPPGGFGTRPLVAADYPGFQDSLAPVWQLTGYDTAMLTNGFHTLQVRVTDAEGDSNFISGEVTFRVDNTAFALLGLYKPTGDQP